MARFFELNNLLAKLALDEVLHLRDDLLLRELGPAMAHSLEQLHQRMQRQACS